MTQGSYPVRVLFVDDEPERHEGLIALLGSRVEAVAVHPVDLELSDLEGVDLVSVDEYLGDEWQGLARRQSTLALRNLDGLSVAASFRSQERVDDHSFAVSLHTADLAQLAVGLPASQREALTASQHDLDWVFEWGQPSFGPRIVQLAEAVRSVQHANLGADAGAGWLAMPDRDWGADALRQIEICRPPAHALSDNTGGRSYVRWLSQRILPYPTFLLDPHHASNLMGIGLDSFELVAKSPVFKEFAAEYVGPLAGFMSPRWWRAGLLEFMESAGATQWDGAEEKANAISEVTGMEVPPKGAKQGVVAYDADGYVVGTAVDPADAVRLQQDGWPVFADDPWAFIDYVRENPSVRRLVASGDRWRLGDEAVVR